MTDRLKSSCSQGSHGARANVQIYCACVFVGKMCGGVIAECKRRKLGQRRTMSFCASRSRELSCFLFADAFPIAVVGVVLFVGTTIFLCLFHSDKFKSLREDFISVIIKIADLMLLDKKLNDERVGGSVNIGDTKKKFLQRNNLRNPYILGMFLFALCFSALYVFAIFWDTFLINRRQDNCVNDLYCYIVNNEIISSRLDCCEYEMEEHRGANMSVICYSFTLNIGQAWADAGGAMATTAAEFLSAAAVINKMTSEILGKDWGKRKESMRLVLLHVVQTLMGIVLYCVGVLPSLIKLSLDRKQYTDIPKVAYTIILFFQILLLSNIPWHLAYEEKSSRDSSGNRQESTNEGGNQHQPEGGDHSQDENRTTSL